MKSLQVAMTIIGFSLVMQHQIVIYHQRIDNDIDDDDDDDNVISAYYRQNSNSSGRILYACSYTVSYYNCSVHNLLYIHYMHIK